MATTNQQTKKRFQRLRMAADQRPSAGRRSTAGNPPGLLGSVDGALQAPGFSRVLCSPGLALDRVLRRNLAARHGAALEAQMHSRGPATSRTTAEARPSADPLERQADSLARPAQRNTAFRATGQSLNLLERVRIHTDPDAARSAQALHAQAYTIGRDIVFGPGRFKPDTPSGRDLLMHELSHVAQQSRLPQNRSAIQFRVTPGYEGIRERLTYRIFLDWVITDQEAREVLATLDGLSERDLADTVAAMDRDGLVNRLLENIADDDQERYAVLIGRIHRYRSVTRSTDGILDRLTTGFFDWAVTDDDARQAFNVLMGLDPQQLRTVVARMINNQAFDTLLEELPGEEHRRYAAFIERLRGIRDEFTALVSAHGQYLRSRPGGAGSTVRRTVEETGYGGSTSTWSDLDEEQQRQWRERADRVIAEVVQSVRGTDLEDIVNRSHLVFSPERCEQNNAYAFVSGGNTLYFARSWIRNADDNPENVWQSIAHELGGHEEFGNTWAWEIMRATLRGMTPAERREALGGANSLYSAYGYLETEIYAELRELPHRVPTSGGDRPESRPGRPGDVHKQLRRIRNAFGPDVGRQIALRLYYRVLGDPRISEAARRLLYTEVQAVFGLFPIVEPVPP